VSKLQKIVPVAIVTAVLFASGVRMRVANAQKLQTIPKTQDTLLQGEDEVKTLLLLVDTNKTGKVSEQEFIRFMEAEFKRLDKNKSGEIDTKTLVQSQSQVVPAARMGK
jgi:Ca2+-binding EF-hand superfamily protein